MGNVILFFQNILKIFSPSYAYTLDKSFIEENNDAWLFKEFGTHSYIMKTWKQLQSGELIRELNPKDILYIAHVEIRRQIENKHFHICEEKRDGVYILICDDLKISVTAEEFLKDTALVSRTEHHDVIKIAYYSGLKKGRLISSYTSNKIASHIETKRQILTLIK